MTENQLSDWLSARLKAGIEKAGLVLVSKKKLAEERAALAPFAVIAGEGSEDFDDAEKVVVTFGRTTHHALTLGDLRRARSVLEDRSLGLADATNNPVPLTLSDAGSDAEGLE